MTATRPAPAAAPARYEFHCSACERVEYAPTPELPKGWEPTSVDAGTAALCPECAAWLEQVS